MIAGTSWWMDVVLAFVQGTTEIFPVSSSGHLVIFSKIFGRSMSFGLLLFFHLGTFLAILVRYRQDAWNILTGRLGRKLPVFLLLGLFVTGLVGLFFKGLAERIIANQARIVSYMWMINGLVIASIGLLSPNGARRIEQLQLQDILLIGFVQGITAIPGLSRLGLTLGIGLIIGLIWRDALKLSFLLSLPTILFANLYGLCVSLGWIPTVGYVSAAGSNQAFPISISATEVLLGGLILVISFVSVLLSIWILSSHLSRKLLAYFGFYCVSAGMFFILYIKLI